MDVDDGTLSQLFLKATHIWFQWLCFPNKVLFTDIKHSGQFCDHLTPANNWDNLSSSTGMYMILADKWEQKVGIFGPKSGLNCEYCYWTPYLYKDRHALTWYWLMDRDKKIAILCPKLQRFVYSTLFQQKKSYRSRPLKWIETICHYLHACTCYGLRDRDKKIAIFCPKLQRFVYSTLFKQKSHIEVDP